MSGFDPAQMGFIAEVIVESDWSFFTDAHRSSVVSQGAATDTCCLIEC